MLERQALSFPNDNPREVGAPPVDSTTCHADPPALRHPHVREPQRQNTSHPHLQAERAECLRVKPRGGSPNNTPRSRVPDSSERGPPVTRRPSRKHACVGLWAPCVTGVDPTSPRESRASPPPSHWRLTHRTPRRATLGRPPTGCSVGEPMWLWSWLWLWPWLWL